jgi:hypothetical protein
MWPLLIARLSSGKACVILLFGPSDFVSHRRLPFVDGTWYFVSIEHLAVDHFV